MIQSGDQPTAAKTTTEETFMSYATVNPYTGETIKTFPYVTDAEVSQAIDAAHAAFLLWRKSPFGERTRVMQKAADILRAQSEKYARLLTDRKSTRLNYQISYAVFCLKKKNKRYLSANYRCDSLYNFGIA